MSPSDELLPLSALQHLVFCERQAALIHLEGQWAENRFTVEGRHLHERVDEGQPEARGEVRVTRSLRLESRRLGLVGRADAVEWHHTPAVGPSRASGVELPGASGLWRPYPVEYKRGRPKETECDRVQLCAQALCLEEMLGVAVPAGALFYGRTRRRSEVAFDAALRERTEAAAVRLREIFASRTTPPPVDDARCRRCSLVDRCLPAAPRRSAARYLERALRQAAAPREAPS